MTIPKILRILVIDDRAGKGALAETIRNTLYAMAKTCEGGNSLDYVDVVFADTPEDGVKKWQEQVFDLTLIDSDFGEKTKTEQESSASNLFDVHARHIGIFAFQLLRYLQNPKEAYGYRDNTCRVYVWSSLSKKEVSGFLGSIKSNDKGKRKGISGSSQKWQTKKDWYIPKQIPDGSKKIGQNSFPDLQDAVQKATDAVLGNFKAVQVAERFICYYRISKTLPRQLLSKVPFVDGYLLHTTKSCPCLAPLRIQEKKRKYVYFSVRQFTNKMILDGMGWAIHLGPSVRDNNIPLTALIKQLFPDKNGKCCAGINWLQDEQPLTAEEQLCLLYRSDQTGGKREPKTNYPNRDKLKNAKKEGNNIKEGVVAAATPLTGISAIGLKDACKLLGKKVVALLDGPFDKIVLKTVYEDHLVGAKSETPRQEPRWPALQAQSHHRTRCLRSTGHPRTLWNTGKTALEMFTPRMLNLFLRYIEKSIDENEQKRIIVSLGSKYPQADEDAYSGASPSYRNHNTTPSEHTECFKFDLESGVWAPLFNTVFKGVGGSFEWVEINVRHYLREAVEFHLGGNEYLSPHNFGVNFSGRYDDLLAEFRLWLNVIDDVARRENLKKKVILKFPFRSDLLVFINCVFEHCNQADRQARDSGICGITLINAFKSVVCRSSKSPPYTPAWYSLPNGEWKNPYLWDYKYQMSGEMLNASRNQLLSQILGSRSFNNGICHWPSDFDLHIGGGVVSQNDMGYCFDGANLISNDNERQGKTYVQLGTWPLLSLDLARDSMAQNCSADSPSRGGAQPSVSANRCQGEAICGRCSSVCDKKAITFQNYQPIISQKHCGNCGKCVDVCPKEVFSYSKDILVKDNRHPFIVEKWCRSCGICVNTSCVFEVFEKPYQKGTIPIVKNKDNCTQCGKCISNCPTKEPAKAIKLVSQTVPLQKNKEIAPRISYLIHEICTGCGDCSRSFYCDSFLDREGKKRPPLMDPRNCTGCGLCAQICSKGAIQLFETKHIAVLISGRGERPDLLRAMQIPHLSYHPTNDLTLILQDKRTNSAKSESFKRLMAVMRDLQMKKYSKDKKTILTRVADFSIALWVFRLEHDPFVLGSGELNDYEDKRWQCLAGGNTEFIPESSSRWNESNRQATEDWIKQKVESHIEKLVKELEEAFGDECDTPLCLAVIERSLLWSQLIWSDPGQVLWDCPIIVIKMSAADGNGLEIADDSLLYPTGSNNVNAALVARGTSPFSINVCWTVLQNGVVHGANVQKKWYGLEPKWIEKPGSVKKYAGAGLGQGRFLGLDARACPDMLRRYEDEQDKKGRALSYEDTLHVCGLPWDSLRQVDSINNIVRERDSRLSYLRKVYLNE